MMNKMIDQWVSFDPNQGPVVDCKLIAEQQSKSACIMQALFSVILFVW
jgi:hypothetical protein